MVKSRKTNSLIDSTPYWVGVSLWPISTRFLHSPYYALCYERVDAFCFSSATSDVNTPEVYI